MQATRNVHPDWPKRDSRIDRCRHETSVWNAAEATHGSLTCCRFARQTNRGSIQHTSTNEPGAASSALPEPHE